jgi:hypothetical protein
LLLRVTVLVPQILKDIGSRPNLTNGASHLTDLEFTFVEVSLKYAKS